MTTKDYNDYRAAAALGLIPDEENPIFLFNSTSKDILLDIVNGKIDAIKMAKLQLAERGLDTKTGKFIGWKKEAPSYELV